MTRFGRNAFLGLQKLTFNMAYNVHGVARVGPELVTKPQPPWLKIKKGAVE